MKSKTLIGILAGFTVLFTVLFALGELSLEKDWWIIAMWLIAVPGITLPLGKKKN